MVGGQTGADMKRVEHLQKVSPLSHPSGTRATPLWDTCHTPVGHVPHPCGTRATPLWDTCHTPLGHVNIGKINSGDLGAGW